MDEQLTHAEIGTISLVNGRTMLVQDVRGRNQFLYFSGAPCEYEG
jgi:hypothetical protein